MPVVALAYLLVVSAKPSQTSLPAQHEGFVTLPAPAYRGKPADGQARPGTSLTVVTSLPGPRDAPGYIRRRPPNPRQSAFIVPAGRGAGLPTAPREQSGHRHRGEQQRQVGDGQMEQAYR